MLNPILDGLSFIVFGLLAIVGALTLFVRVVNRLERKPSPTTGTPDGVEVAKLEFLLQETSNWPEAQTLREPYVARLVALRGVQAPTSPLAHAPEATPPPPAAAPAPAVPAAPAAREIIAEPALAPTPARETEPSAPFDQWLLSERNIKIALYTGGILLIMAGLIFIGVNWQHLPGLAKLAVTFGMTALMYAGGILLYRRASLRIGGVALLAVASGFAPLNFAVLHIYLLAERGISSDTTLVFASAVCLLTYALTAVRTRHALFTYFSLIALASGISAAYAAVGISFTAGVLFYAIVGFALGLAAFAVRERWFAGFVSRPLLIAANVAAPLVFIMAVAGWVGSQSYVSYNNGPVWLLFLAMLFVGAHYVAADRLYRRIEARWAAAILFAVTVILFLMELNLSSIATGILLKALALVYLVVGFILMGGRGKPVRAGLPLFATGYALAAFVTYQALGQIAAARDQPALALLADVALLVVSAILFRDLRWVFGAVWLFIAPVLLYATIYLQRVSDWGLALGALLLAYVAVGYLIGRRAFLFGSAFLSAAVLLTVVVPALMMPNWALTSFALLVIAGLYLLVALWRRWSWLLLASLVAVNLALSAAALVYFTPEILWTRFLTIGFAGLGLGLAAGGIVLSTMRQPGWRLPLYTAAFVDLLGAYVAALGLADYERGTISGRVLVILLSALLALLAWTLTWFERTSLSMLRMPRLFSYLAPVLLFLGLLYLPLLVIPSSPYQMALVAGFCAVFVGGSYVVRGEPWRSLYAEPLRRAGLGLLLFPLAGILVDFRPLPTAVAYAIGSLVLLGDAAARRDRYLFYLGSGLLIVVIWSLLRTAGVAEPQAYAIPPGLGLLVLGWEERRHGKRAFYQLATLLGLVVLMGSAFVQSFDQTIYAALLFAESLAAFAWGLRIRSRRYVEMAVLALVLNAVAQYGPAFAQLDRWIQIGTIGALLLGGGLAALFRREKILATRQTLSQGWRGLEP